MNNECDLFLVTPTCSDSLRFLTICDHRFSYQGDVKYKGYLGVSIHRVKLIPMIDLLRKQGVKAYSVPIDYKKGPLISREEALEIARAYARGKDLEVIANSEFAVNDNPLIWKFTPSCLRGERAGGMLMVDTLDGHIWSLDEFDIYMYDYNNSF